MVNIPSTMVIYKHVDRSDTIFSTMSGPLVNNPLGKWLGVTRRDTYQAVSEDNSWAYKEVSDLCPDVDICSDSNDNGSIDEGGKDKYNPYDK